MTPSLLPLLLAATLAPEARAVPPLVVAADEAEAGLRAWWKEGDLLVAPPAGDPRPGVRPLVGPAPVVLPAALDGWQPLLDTCSEAPDPPAFSLGERTARARVERTDSTLIVRVSVDDRVVAEGALGRPAEPCSLTVGQADALPGKEVLLGWRTAAGVTGLTVFRIPDTAR